MTTLSADETSRFVQAGGYRVHFHEAGEGDAVIMLHGSGPGANGYSNYQKNFAAFASRYRTLLVDMLGFGQTDHDSFEKEPRMVVQPRVLRDLMDELGIERAHFVGNSMGGTTSLSFAVDFPERTDRLVLMGAGGMVYKPVFYPGPSEGHRRLREASTDPSMETMQGVANAMLFDPSVMSADVLEARVKVAQDVLAKRLAAGPVEMAPERPLRDELWQVRAKSLIIWGKDDRVNPLEIGLQLLRDVEDSTLVVLKNCGHWAQAERTEEFNRIALEFLAS